MHTERPTVLNRISFAFVLMLLAVVVMGAISVAAAAAGGDDKVVAHRDSGPGSGRR